MPPKSQSLYSLSTAERLSGIPVTIPANSQPSRTSTPDFWKSSIGKSPSANYSASSTPLNKDPTKRSPNLFSASKNYIDKSLATSRPTISRTHFLPAFTSLSAQHWHSRTSLRRRLSRSSLVSSLSHAHKRATPSPWGVTGNPSNYRRNTVLAGRSLRLGLPFLATLPNLPLTKPSDRAM